MSDTGQEVYLAVNNLSQAYVRLTEALDNNCPGPHTYELVNDGEDRFCKACGFDKNGELHHDPRFIYTYVDELPNPIKRKKF